MRNKTCPSMLCARADARVGGMVVGGSVTVGILMLSSVESSVVVGGVECVEGCGGAVDVGAVEALGAGCD